MSFWANSVYVVYVAERGRIFGNCNDTAFCAHLLPLLIRERPKSSEFNVILSRAKDLNAIAKRFFASLIMTIFYFIYVLCPLSFIKKVAFRGEFCYNLTYAVRFG